MVDPLIARRNMVREQIEARGVNDPRILGAMMDIPRHKFVDAYLKYQAYDDAPLTIGYGQTISQPYMVALMTEALKPEADHKVLEIGTGSGYQAAILSKLCSSVYTIERLSVLAARARKVLDELGIFNVHIRIGDGTRGYAKDAPYDRIMVTAGAPHVPEALVEQLAPGGILVIPVGDQYLQDLKRITKKNGQTFTESLGGCRFVKLIGEGGWKE